MGLNKLLNTIGNEITACRIRCEGIKNEPKEGIYPRCFYPEIKKKSGYFDYIVIGINPGTATDLERAFVNYIKSHKPNFGFEDIKIVSKPIIESFPYYKWVRIFLKKYSKKKNLNILWTELVKCQSQPDNNKNKLPKERCFEKFLKREIRIFVKYKKPPVFVLLGNEVFLFIKQYIKEYGKEEFEPSKYLKLYHPTGSRKFHSYFQHKDIKNNLLKSRIPKLENF